REQPRQQGAQNQDLAARWGQLQAGLERAIANNVSFNIPLDANGAEAARQILAYGREWSQVRDLFQVTQQVLGDHSDLPIVRDVLRDVTGIRRTGDNGENLEIQRRAPMNIELGPLTIKLDEKIQIKVSKENVGNGVEGTAINLSFISGINA